MGYVARARTVVRDCARAREAVFLQWRFSNG
jgi:hypothetical protein